MQSFLNKLANSVIQDHEDNLGEVTIVLPSRRAILFLREEFRKELKTASWLPQIISLEDFIQGLHDLTIVDDIDVLFYLYDIHIQLEGEKAEPFEDFIGWASILLHDFNEVDQHLVDHNELFRFLSEAKAIENWNLDGTQLSDFQLNYLNFWRKLGIYYSKLSHKLIEEKKAYQGLSFRYVAERLVLKKINTSEINTLLFAGFNALTKAESSIISYFKQEKNAQVYWDADAYYMDDSFQEAGKFLRKHKNQSKSSFLWESDHLLNDEKNINIYGVSGNIGQSKLIGNLLLKQNQQKTALVLADEELLPSALESIPNEIDSINVTMGYPLSHSIIYSWIESYFMLFKNINDDFSPSAFYHKDLKKVLEHPILNQLVTLKEIHLDEFLLQLQREKSIFIAPHQLENFDKSIGIDLFKIRKEQAIDIIERITSFLVLLNTTSNDIMDSLNQECLNEFIKLFNKLHRLICDFQNQVLHLIFL